jgi:hypothetical protein
MAICIMGWNYMASSTHTGLGPPPRNFSPQTPLPAAGLIVSQRTWPLSVGTHKLSDQQHTLAEHRAMRSSPAPKHNACAVVSEDTIAKAAAQSHADGGSGGTAHSCCPRHRQAPLCSAEPLAALHPSTRQPDEHHAGHAIHHAAPRGHRVRYIPNWSSRGGRSEPPNEIASRSRKSEHDTTRATERRTSQVRLLSVPHTFS